MRTLLGPAALAGTLLLVAGCGSGSAGSSSSSSSGSAAASPSSSPSSASAAASASASSSGAGSASGTLDRSDVFSRLTAAQKKAGSYRFTLDVGLGGQSLTGTGEADTSTTPASVQVSEKVAGQQVETITTGGLVYLKSAVLGGGKWVKIDPKASSGLGQMLGQLGSSDPTSTLAALQDVATVHRGGSSQVGGTAVTEYDVAVPSSALVKSSALGQQLQSSLPKTITYRLFVDHDDLLRRLASSLTVQGRAVDTTIDFSDYGAKVAIAAPPASQVTTAPAGLG